MADDPKPTPNDLIEVALARLREVRSKAERARQARLQKLTSVIDRTARREASRLQSGDRTAKLLEEAASLKLDPVAELKNETPMSTIQIAIMLGKYRSGYRPGDEGWSPEDQAAYDRVVANHPEVLAAQRHRNEQGRFDLAYVEEGSALVPPNIDRALRIQFAKLVNFFSADLDPRWGGTYYQDSPADLQKAFEDFASLQIEDRCWAHKRFAGTPWGPGNIVFRGTPWSGFRDPEEAYFTCRGVTLTLADAASVLGVESAVLLDSKLTLFRDEEVIVKLFEETADERR